MVDDLACSLAVPRSALHIVAASKGLVSGSLTLRLSNGSAIDCTSSPHAGVLIPPANTIESLRVAPHVTTVVVVEKDAVFVSLLQSPAFLQSPHVILITSCRDADSQTWRRDGWLRDWHSTNGSLCAWQWTQTQTGSPSSAATGSARTPWATTATTSRVLWRSGVRCGRLLGRATRCTRTPSCCR
ncbi:Spo11/DNA topoisomerase VI subunit A [Entophlyctis helioformis]|nr:Spo11/DNA topoisomerase VI subunit A [Entophlyctis helioformis]